MICDNIKHSAIYTELHPLFSAAFEFLSNKADILDDGKYELDSDNLFVIITSSTLKGINDAKLEAHNQYIDIQYIIDGEESFGYMYRDNCSQPISQFDSEKDIIFYSDKIENRITLSKGEFVIFYPQDSHAPLIGCGTSRKAIVKVRCGK